jgi:Dynamin family
MKAVEISGSKQFIDDHTIQVHIEGPELVNATLVDLPGFHTANDRDTQTVNDMVKRYIETPETLVLRVVKGDQDYASLLGNDFMRQASSHGNSRVTVLTYCDNLKVQSEYNTTRLRTTLDMTNESSSLTVAFLGCAQDDEEENLALRHLPAIDNRIAIGRAEAASHLEHQINTHLSKHFPKAVTKLRKSYVILARNWMRFASDHP